MVATSPNRAFVAGRTMVLTVPRYARTVNEWVTRDARTGPWRLS
jgi:hypothetical protein